MHAQVVLLYIVCKVRVISVPLSTFRFCPLGKVETRQCDLRKQEAGRPQRQWSAESESGNGGLAQMQ